MAPPHSILIIGSSGRTGLHIAKQIREHGSKNNLDCSSTPAIFGFCRSAAKLHPALQKYCYDDVWEGDANNPADLEDALVYTRADLVILCTDSRRCMLSQSPRIRTQTAQALVHVLKQRDFCHVKVLVLSSIGAGASSIPLPCGLGKLLEFHLRHILADYSGQEEAFLHLPKERVWILRLPPCLVEHHATGKVVVCSDAHKCPTLKLDRQDLAQWIVKVLFLGTRQHLCFFGSSRPLNIVGAK